MDKVKNKTKKQPIKRQEKKPGGQYNQRDGNLKKQKRYAGDRLKTL